MPLVLPRSYRFLSTFDRRGIRWAPRHAPPAGRPVLRVGIVNLMPRAELYEELLLSALGAALPPTLALEPVWIRLDSHDYRSSDAAHLARHYVRAERAASSSLDALMLTGAPVEELAFEDVRYWRELSGLLTWARQRVSSTLGLCWGAMALAKLLGVEKQALPRKLFGMYSLEPLEAGRGYFGENDTYCPQSRHAGVSEQELERAARDGRARLLARSPEAGHAIFTSGDGRFLMHQGHPEYRPERLLYEYRRDRALGRRDVGAPLGVDLEQPERSVRSNGRSFFGAWLHQLATPQAEKRASSTEALPRTGVE
ncbi:MAG: homoserine O-succinyltransferase [Myxococcales bacterium]